jgi:Ca2+-binding EF-hand superfamily protein
MKLNSCFFKDKDGFIDKKEMAKIIEAIYDLLDKKKDPNSIEERVEAIIAKFDKNSDRKLSKDEFIYGCTNDEVIRDLIIPIN